VADDESTTSAHDEHDTGELSDEGQAQATRVTIENESKVTGAVDKAEAARVIVNASNLDGDESDKEDSDATKEDSSVQEDVSQPSPSAIEDDTGRVQALEMEIADLIATLQVSTCARLRLHACMVRCLYPLFGLSFSRNRHRFYAMFKQETYTSSCVSSRRLFVWNRPRKLELRWMLLQLGIGKRVPLPLSQVAVIPAPPQTTITRCPPQSLLLRTLRTIN